MERGDFHDEIAALAESVAQRVRGAEFQRAVEAMLRQHSFSDNDQISEQLITAAARWVTYAVDVTILLTAGVYREVDDHCRRM